MNYDANDLELRWTMFNLPKVRVTDLSFESEKADTNMHKSGIDMLKRTLPKILAENISKFAVIQTGRCYVLYNNSTNKKYSIFKARIIFTCKEDADLYLMLISDLVVK